MFYLSKVRPRFPTVIVPFLLWTLLAGASSHPPVSSNGPWLALHSDSVPISMLNIPGTHDSGADRGCPGPLFDRYAKCQNWSIHQQLEAGIRYLDIRCRRAGFAFQIYHGQCSQGKTFADVLDDCTDFLNQYPSETILMRVKEEHRPKEGSSSFKEIFMKYLEDYPADKWYLNSETPQLGNVRGRIVLLDDAGLNMGIPWSRTRRQDEYALRNYEQKWAYVASHLEKARQSSSLDIFINHCTATAFGAGPIRLLGATLGMVKSPKGFSKYILPKLEDYLLANQNEGRYGIVVMDFPTVGAIQQLVKSNAYLKQLR